MTEMEARILREQPDWEQGREDHVRQNSVLLCFHETTEYLGSGGSIVYRRCTKCGDVVLVQGGRAIAIPSR